MSSLLALPHLYPSLLCLSLQVLTSFFSQGQRHLSLHNASLSNSSVCYSFQCIDLFCPTFEEPPSHATSSILVIVVLFRFGILLMSATQGQEWRPFLCARFTTVSSTIDPSADRGIQPGGTVGYPAQPGLTGRNRRLPSPTRINLKEP